MTTVGQRPFWQSRLVRTLIATVGIGGIGGLIIWGYVEGRGEAEREAERERPIKEPLRISTKNGMPVVTLDNDTQRNSGIESTRLESAPFQQQVRAYGMVLDLARLTDLSNNDANAKAQFPARTGIGQDRSLVKDGQHQLFQGLRRRAPLEFRGALIIAPIARSDSLIRGAKARPDGQVLATGT